MYKLLIAIALLTSCTAPTSNDVTEKTEVPLNVSHVLTDTTVKPDVILVEGTDKYYVVKQYGDKRVIERSIEKEMDYGVAILLVLLLLVCLFGFIAMFID